MVAAPITPHPLDRPDAPQRKLTDSTCITANTPSKKDGLSSNTSTSASQSLSKQSKNANSSSPCYRVDVIIQCLEDVDQHVYEREEDNRNHHEPGQEKPEKSLGISGALVAFGGCSMRNNIQVGSSSICNQTGHLLVESQKVKHDESSLITWRTEEQPHMSIYMPAESGEDEHLDEKQFDNNNNTVALKETEAPYVPISVSYSNATDTTESTAGWSLLADRSSENPGNIVEVLIRLQQTPHMLQSKAATASFWDGVAYLILPSQPGQHVVSVPVKIPKTSTKMNHGNGDLTGPTVVTPRDELSPLHGAMLHVSVDVSPFDEYPATPSVAPTAQTTPPPSPPMALSGVGQGVADPSQRKQFKANEDCKNQNEKQMDINILPMKHYPPAEPCLPQELPKEKSAFSKWWDVLKYYACDMDNSCVPIQPFQEADMDDNSTIATRPSLGI